MKAWTGWVAEHDELIKRGYAAEANETNCCATPWTRRRTPRGNSA